MQLHQTGLSLRLQILWSGELTHRGTNLPQAATSKDDVERNPFHVAQGVSTIEETLACEVP